MKEALQKLKEEEERLKIEEEERIKKLEEAETQREEQVSKTNFLQVQVH